MRLAAAFFAIIFLAVPNVGAQDQAALITELDGTVTVNRADGSSIKARWGTQLFAGDTVVTGSASSASILYSDNNLTKLGANDQEDISSGSGGASSSGVDPTLLADVSDLTLHRTGAGEVAALGGLRSSGAQSGIQVVAPRSGLVRTTRPVFKWSAFADFEAYSVTVLSEAGKVWSGSTSEKTITYPESAPALQQDAVYYWRVAGEDMLDVVQSEMVSFGVLSAEAVGEIEAGETRISALFADDEDDASHDYMLGSYYAKQGLVSEAITAFERIASDHGESAFVQEILAKLYLETGDKDRSIAALKRAIELARLD